MTLHIASRPPPLVSRQRLNAPNASQSRWTGIPDAVHAWSALPHRPETADTACRTLSACFSERAERGGREGELDDSCNAAAPRFHAAPGTIQRLVRELGLHGSSASGSGARVR